MDLFRFTEEVHGAARTTVRVCVHFLSGERGLRAKATGSQLWRQTAIAVLLSHPRPPLSLSLSSGSSSRPSRPSGRTHRVSGAALHPFHCSFNPHYDTTRLYFPLSEMGRVRLRKAQKSGPSHTASKPGQSGRTFNYSIMLPAALMGFGEGGRGVVLPPTYCVTLGKSFYLSKPQSPHL